MSPREVVERAQAVTPDAVDVAWMSSPLCPRAWPPAGEPTVTTEVMELAAAPLIEAAGARSLPAPEAPKRVREAYREWAVEHSGLAAELRRQGPDVFTWLDER